MQQVIMELDPASIIIGPRQRIDLGDIDGFAEDMKLLGVQITPGTVRQELDGSYHLVAGRRRLAAVTKLGWKFKCINEGALSPQLAQQIEWAEDVHRKDRNPMEKCLALYRLRNALETDSGRRWGLRELEKYTGLGKSAIGHMLEVAAAIDDDPTDEALVTAAQESWVNAYKVLQERELARTQKELERRRQLRAQQEQQQKKLELAPVILKPGEGPAVPSPVQSLDMTPAKEEEPIVIYLRGTNMDFVDAIPDEHFFADQYQAVVAHGLDPRGIGNAARALKPEGYLIYWEDEKPLIHDSSWMPFPLIWNRIETPEVGEWPFACSYSRGYVFTRKATRPMPKSAVVACHPDGGLLPLAVMEHSLAPCPPNMAVLLTNNANVVAVAELGFVPIWFESDKAKFEAQCAALKEHYERNIPNVEVKL